MKNISNESLARHLVTIFYSNKIVVILIFLMVFLPFLAYSVLAPDMYRAEGAFLVQAKNTDIALNHLNKNEIRPLPVKRVDLYSESQLLNSGHVISSAVQKLMNEKVLSAENNNQQATGFDSLEKNISDNYSVDIDNKSKLIKPSIEWSDPEQATIILNKLMDAFLEYRSEMFKSTQTEDIFQPQSSGYLDQWKKKKQQILDLVKKHNVPDADLELANNLELKKEYQIQIANIEEDKVSLKEDIKILTSMLNENETHLFSFLSSGVLSSLVDSLQAIQKEKLSADKLFLPSRNEVKELDAQLKKNYGKIRSEVESHLRKQESVLKAKEQSITNLKSSLKKLERRNIKLKEIAIKMDQLKMESSFLASSFETSYQSHNASLTGGSLHANIILLSPARSEMTLDKEARIKIALLGLFIAFALSFMIALILDAMENRIKTQRDFQKHIKLPVLFSIEDRQGRKS